MPTTTEALILTVEPDIDWPRDDLAIVAQDGMQLATVIGNQEDQIQLADLFAASPRLLLALRQIAHRTVGTDPETELLACVEIAREAVEMVEGR